MEENRTMTAAERAKLADAREAEAQRRKYNNSAQHTAQRPRPTQTAAQPQKKAASNTREYPNAPHVRQSAGAPRPVKRVSAPPKTHIINEEKVDTGEFPSYVRKGKGGYHPPKAKKRVVARQHRRKLDPKFKAAIFAVLTLAVIAIVLLLLGVRYSTYKLANGEIRFFGLVKDGVPTSGWIYSSDGSGGKLEENMIKYSDGSLYEGGIVNVMRSGEGTMTYKNGDVYTGYFSENELNGKGSVTYANGDTYEGDFKNGKKHGNGILKYKTVGGYDVYEGEFKEDRRSGKGTMTYVSGDVYVGEFENDLKHGEGVYTHENGRTFEGTYKNNLRHEGKFTFENKAYFVGTFENSPSNQMLEGTYTYANGASVTGRYDKATNSFIAY